MGAYDKAAGSMLSEFAHDEAEFKRVKAHGALAGEASHTAMHEVIGHASGQLEEGVETPKETIKEYSSTLKRVELTFCSLLPS